MPALFGTDGIRGLANQHPMTVEMGLKLGRAMVHQSHAPGVEQPRVVIGRDTRGSGRMLECAVTAGVLAAGGRAVEAGVLPTPGVAYLTRALGAAAGVVISASHNPYPYNGFKLFDSAGFKFSEDLETRIENLLVGLEGSPDPTTPGTAEPLHDATERYVAFLREALPRGAAFEDRRVVIDCANGAAYRAAPALLRSLGVRLWTLSDRPDGENINRDCGSEHPDRLIRAVRECDADLGLALDGDADRLIAVDEKGQLLSGDHLLAICARALKEESQLPNELVVSTVMSNVGLGLALKRLGLRHVSCPVGDRFVSEEMRARGAVLGGENSGHIIFLTHHTTGDGLLAALKLLWSMATLGAPLSELATLMRAFPQALLSVPVRKKPALAEVPELCAAIEAIEGKLGDQGRVLVRHSGTEPVCRVLVEGPDRELTEAYARDIARVISQLLG